MKRGKSKTQTVVHDDHGYRAEPRYTMQTHLNPDNTSRLQAHSLKPITTLVAQTTNPDQTVGAQYLEPFIIKIDIWGFRDAAKKHTPTIMAIAGVLFRFYIGGVMHI